MNYQHGFVNLNPSVGNTEFREFTCPTCGTVAKPHANGQSHPVHGYKLYCPSCNRWLGWGGKSKNLIDQNGERKFSSQWSAKRLQATYCQCCLRQRERLGEKEVLEIHHVIPIKDGGTDALENIWVLCTTCHKEVHHRRVFFNGHMEKFFKAYQAFQQLKDKETKGDENG